ncbi:MAG: family 2 glycosyl transferase [Planctomycetaceae bacterium]|nr:family 2 glycosyl transferase [Planctomycetaceae bacterium]
MPNVSIVMAAKNYARFLPMAVESVLAQTFTDWELVIVDDGSTDNTPAVVRPFLADSRIRYFRSDKLGQTRAKNLGLRLSRGEFVAFIDADDAWSPTKLDKQLAVFREKPDVGVVFCRRSLIDEQSRPIPAKPAPTPPRGRVLDKLFVQNFVCFSTAVARREVFSQVGAFDPQWDLAIDFDLWLRVAKHHAFDYVDEELVQYRTGHGNLSKKLLDRVDTAFSIMHRAENRYGVAEQVPAGRVAEAYASTCRTLGYVLRNSEPVTAAKWYLRALRWPAGRVLSVKGLVASALRFASGKREPSSHENASVNR